MNQQNYEPLPPPPLPTRRYGLDNQTLLLLLGAGCAALICLGAVSVACLLLVMAPPPPPSAPQAAENPTVPVVIGTPLPTATPTVDTASIGKYINPYISAGLAGMTVLQIDVRDPATGNYVRAQQLTGSDLDKFAEAFNVSVKTVAPDNTCPDHVRLSITRADSSVVTMGVCLKGSVILRGGIPDLGGADAPMYPGFTDALAPYLPEDYKRLLDL